MNPIWDKQAGCWNANLLSVSNSVLSLSFCFDFNLGRNKCKCQVPRYVGHDNILVGWSLYNICFFWYVAITFVLHFYRIICSNFPCDFSLCPFLKIEKSTKNSWFLGLLVFFLLLLLFEIFETRTIWQYEIFSFCFLTLPRGKLSCMS